MGNEARDQRMLMSISGKSAGGWSIYVVESSIVALTQSLPEIDVENDDEVPNIYVATGSRHVLPPSRQVSGVQNAIQRPHRIVGQSFKSLVDHKSQEHRCS